MVFKKCAKCGAMVEVLKDCTCENCGIKCCGEQMAEIKENSVECAVEKHLPQVEVIGNYIEVTVNHVMDSEHFIEWFGFEANGTFGKKFFAPNDTAKAIFPYVKGSKVYAYCNKHGLWAVEVK